MPWGWGHHPTHSLSLTLSAWGVKGILFSIYFCSPVPRHWPCSVSSWLGQWYSWRTLHKETYTEAWSLRYQWMFTRMGVLCSVGRNSVVIFVLFVICSSWEIHLKRFGSRWDIRWKDSYLFNIKSGLLAREFLNSGDRWSPYVVHYVDVSACTCAEDRYVFRMQSTCWIKI